MGKIYTRSDRKGAKTIPFGGAGGGAHTFLAHIREYTPPLQEYSQLSLLRPHYRESIIVGVSFKQTSVVYFCLGFSCWPYYRGVCKTRVDRDVALVIDDNVAKKDDDSKYDAAVSIIIIAVM